jgi:ABC-type branched-subunit amino acid transport system ATPase component
VKIDRNHRPFQPALRVTSVSRSFGGIQALRHVSLEAADGEIIGIIGPNGSGKTTLFNLITAVYPMNTGTIHVDGVDISRLSREQIVARGVSRTFQTSRLFESLTVLEHILVGLPKPCRRATMPQFVAEMFTPASRYRFQAMQFLQIVGLEGDADLRASSLPFGKRRLLEIARCLATSPRILLLDEPAAGLNGQEADEVSRIITSKCKSVLKNMIVLVIEHKISFLSGICSRIIALDHGEVICTGAVESVLADPKVIESYLGAHPTDSPPMIPKHDAQLRGRSSA